MANIARERRNILFDTRYRASERRTDAAVHALIDATPGLSTSLAREILRAATGEERQQLKQSDSAQAIGAARLVGRSTKCAAARAFEGFYLDSINPLDTHRLALHSLETTPGVAGQFANRSS